MLNDILLNYHVSYFYTFIVELVKVRYLYYKTVEKDIDSYHIEKYVTDLVMMTVSGLQSRRVVI